MSSKIEVLELSRNGASIAWSDSEGATAVIRLVMEVAQQLSGNEPVARIGLHSFSDPSLSISSTTVAQLLSRAPLLLSRDYRYFTFDLQINDAPPVLAVAPLDQGLTGVSFTVYDGGDDSRAEQFHEAIEANLRSIARTEPHLVVDGGSWIPNLNR